MNLSQFKIYIASVFTLSLLASSAVIAQQEAQYAHNMFHNAAINPAFVGSLNGICATGLARQQWVGFKDQNGDKIAPETYSISINSPISVLHGGIGGTVYSDKLGFWNEIGVSLSYAYRVDVGMGNLGIGVQFGFINGKIDFTKLIEGALDKGDPLLDGKAQESDMLLNFGFGLHYFIPNKFYVGLSSTRLSESSSPGDILAYKTKRHYYFSAGYIFTFQNNPSWEIDPSILVKSDITKTQIDIAALVKYNNKVWAGVSYSTIRVVDPLSILVGLSIKDIKIGYAYTIPSSNLGSSGSHEVMVGYCFKIDMDKGRRSYKNTRFL